MAIAERLITMLAQFAKAAQTNIPTPPVPGIAYRNAELTAADFENGQAYDKVYDSARYNQMDFLTTGLVQSLEQYGILPWSSLTNYPEQGICLGLDGVLYQAVQPSGPGVTGVGAKEPGKAGNELYWLDYAASITPPKQDKYDLCEFYYFRHPTLRQGFQPAQGGLLSNAATLYPDAWAYLQTPAGQLLCRTEAEWQAMTTAVWHTNADGTRVGWNGIGGAPFYVQDLAAGTLRLPDLRGMYAEAAGFDSLDVGGVHGDGMRSIAGKITFVDDIMFRNHNPSGPFYSTGGSNLEAYAQRSGGGYPINMDTGRVVATANKFQPRAWGALACCYLGAPAS